MFEPHLSFYRMVLMVHLWRLTNSKTITERVVTVLNGDIFIKKSEVVVVHHQRQLKKNWTGFGNGLPIWKVSYLYLK